MFFFIYILLSLRLSIIQTVLDENRYVLNVGFYHLKYGSLKNDVNKSVTVCRFVHYYAWKNIQYYLCRYVNQYEWLWDIIQNGQLILE